MIQTPLGRIEITKDEKKVDCTIRRVRNDDRCPELNGRFAVLIDYIPDGQEHTVSCCIKGIRESKSDFIESDERVDIKQQSFQLDYSVIFRTNGIKHQMI